MRVLDERGRLVRDDAGLAPAVTIREESGSEKLFLAEPTAPGKWRARVVFPGAGRWSYTVTAGPAEYFDPVTVAASGGGGVAVPAWAAAVTGALGLALAILLVRRRRAAPRLAAAQRLG